MSTDPRRLRPVWASAFNLVWGTWDRSGLDILFGVTRDAVELAPLRFISPQRDHIGLPERTPAAVETFLAWLDSERQQTDISDRNFAEFAEALQHEIHEPEYGSR